MVEQGAAADLDQRLRPILGQGAHPGAAPGRKDHRRQGHAGSSAPSAASGTGAGRVRGQMQAGGAQLGQLGPGEVALQMRPQPRQERQVAALALIPRKAGKDAEDPQVALYRQGRDRGVQRAGIAAGRLGKRGDSLPRTHGGTSRRTSPT